MACLCFAPATIRSGCLTSLRQRGDASNADRALDTLLWIGYTIFFKIGVAVDCIDVDNLFQITKEL